MLFPPTVGAQVLVTLTAVLPQETVESFTRVRGKGVGRFSREQLFCSGLARALDLEAPQREAEEEEAREQQQEREHGQAEVRVLSVRRAKALSLGAPLPSQQP